MKKIATITSVLCIMFSLNVFGEDATGAQEVKSRVQFPSKEIIVKDNREQPGTVSVISEKQVKNSTATNLVDVINEHVPSFYSGNNRVMGFGVASSGSAKMSVRGMGVSGWGPTTGMPMLINGLDTTTSIMGHPVADIFAMKNIDRIEVLHGPQPVLYGSGAMGGIVNVITRRQETEGFSTEMSGSYGSFNSTDDYVVHQGKTGILDYGVSYNFQRSDGHRSQRTLDGFRLTSDYYNHNGTFRFGLALGDFWYAGFNGYVMKQKISDPGMEYRYYKFTNPTALNNSLKDLETFNILRHGYSVNLMNRYDKFEGMVHLYVNLGVHDAEKTAQNMDSYHQDDVMYGAKATETARLFPGSKITAGIEAKRWGGSAKFPDNTTIPFLRDAGNYYVKNKFITNASVFAMADQKILDYVLISGGVRYTDDSKSGGIVSWQAGVVFYPLAAFADPDISDMKIHAGIARGFKLPDLRQLYLFGPYPVRYPNPYLSPETDLTVEYGIEQSFFNRVTLAVTGYRVFSENMFVPYGAYPNNYWINNYQRVVYDGVESSLKLNVHEFVNVRAGYSYIDNDYRGKRLVFVPRHRVTAGVVFEGYDALLALEGEGVRGVYNDTAAAQKLSDYTVFNLRAAYTILEHVKVFANFYNITDRRYQAFWGYPMPGFHMLGGVTAMF